MITHDVEQGSLEWMELRLGIPTASQFDRILTPITRKPSSAQSLYRAELVAEWLLGHPLEWGSSGWMERGSHLENEARSYYALVHDVTVEKVGFVTNDAQTIGCSPDGVVAGASKGLEIKILGARAHMQAVLEIEDAASKHLGQCQGNMHLLGLESWDLLFYSPSLPSVVHTVERDQEYLDALLPALERFSQGLEEAKSKWAGARRSAPGAEAYLPFIDSELEQLHRELNAAEAEGHVTREFAEHVLSSVLMGRWKEVRELRERMREQVLAAV